MTECAEGASPGNLRTVFVIGIGAGDPAFLTRQATEAIARVDVFFLLDKDGAGKDALTDFRRGLLDAVRPDGGYRLVTALSPERPSGGSSAAYRSGIDTWRRARAQIFRNLLTQEVPPTGTAAFLVWGDPCLYDGTIEILDGLIADGLALQVSVLPGISSIQVLTAIHRLPLNRIGESITITTGRQLAAMDPVEIRNCVVMLDGRAAFRQFAESDLDIYWGAYLGTPDQVTVAGKLRDRADEIAAIIDRERARKGWIMDTYLLRRP